LAAGAGSASGEGSAWLIERFDLIFYNGRHRRWQFFAEDPDASEDPDAAKVAVLNPRGGLHRYQIRSLLATFRQIVRSSVTPCAARFEIASKSIVSHIKIEAPQGDWWKKHNKTYLDYLIATAWHDGIIEEHRRSLHRWFEDPKTEISRAEALTFLSLLPIFEDWDTWGCITRARRSSSHRLSNAFPPPCAQDWAAPLSVVELDYKGKIRGPSAKLLNGPVDIEAICLDLASPGSEPHPSPRQDFFDLRYCQLPQKSHLIPYRFYAALVDPILTKLAPSQSPDRQFIISYPLSVAGRLHFLQIALSPPKDGTVGVSTLWKHWLQVHEQIWTPSLRAFFREEMQRIVTSAFQHEAHSRLNEGISRGTIAHGDRARVATEYDAHLHKCLYHLFPVESVTISNPTTGARVIYGYEPYKWKKDSCSIEVGSNWTDTLKVLPESASRRPLVLEVEGAAIVVDGSYSNQLEKIAEDHRVRHAIVEQQVFLGQLHEGAEDIWRDAENDRRKCKLIVLTWSQSKNWKTLKSADLYDEPIVPIDGMPTGREPFSGRYEPRSIKRHVAQMLNLEKDDDHMILEGLKSVMRPSLLLQISEYFETGAAKVVSHTAPALYFSQNLKQLQTHDQEHYLNLCTRIQAEIVRLNVHSKAIGHLDSFRQSLTKHINCPSVRDLTCVYNDILSEQAKAFRVRTFLDIIRDFRCYYIDPTEIFRPFLSRVVIADGKEYLPQGVAVQRLNELYPHEWVSHTEDACVRRVEYFIYLGSTAKVAPEHTRLKKANMLPLWTKECQAIADLLVHTPDSTHVYFDDQFIKDEHLHAQILTHRVGHETQFDKAVFWVILRMQVWRTIEDQETTPELDVSSFSLQTIEGKLDANPHC